MSLSLVNSREIAEPSIGFTEPSGLSAADEGGFWSVSDNVTRLFRLDHKGKPGKRDDLSGEPQLEGIAEDLPRQRLLMVREDTTEILSLAPDGTLTRFRLLTLPGAEGLVAHFQADENNGLEGITVDPETGAVLIIKERWPRLLIELAPDLSRVVRIQELSAAMGFVSAAAQDDKLDLSGLAWDAWRKGVWITSDTGQAVFFLDLSSMTARGWALMDAGKKKLHPVSNAEGVALSLDGDFLHVITDDGKKSRLLTYRID
ncbi:SdiA-regulated domain-containing protein [Ruegeria sp. WL0004]|uniref:SdiA-regulated domain-containing protein n=2 Tax=Ruegeria marisflavi TaxID=2984152 RepID=A0ABT2WUI7_9RHOB|nr:SdiA-regulated domain-containing protein [Ruegeria sp. WL0004]